jgi:hypothetical protein
MEIIPFPPAVAVFERINDYHIFEQVAAQRVTADVQLAFCHKEICGQPYIIEI